MITAHIHAELIAAFLGDDEPCYGECRCGPCLASRPIPTREPCRRGAWRPVTARDPQCRPGQPVLRKITAIGLLTLVSMAQRAIPTTSSIPVPPRLPKNGASP